MPREQTISGRDVFDPGLRITGAGLLIAAAAIHLDLYLTGYRSIPVIGGLFLLQVIVGFGVGVTVLIAPRIVLALIIYPAFWLLVRNRGPVTAPTS